jgi:hypothetical protein
MTDRTKAEKCITVIAESLVGNEYGAAVVMVTYRAEGMDECERRMASVVMMGGVSAALDVVMLVRRLRDLATELEETIAGKRPMPKREG